MHVASASDADWLIVKSIVVGPDGTGQVHMRAVTNTGTKRVGHVVIGGVMYVVTQGGGS